MVLSESWMVRLGANWFRLWILFWKMREVAEVGGLAEGQGYDEMR